MIRIQCVPKRLDEINKSSKFECEDEITETVCETDIESEHASLFN